MKIERKRRREGERKKVEEKRKKFVRNKYMSISFAQINKTCSTSIIQFETVNYHLILCKLFWYNM